MALNSDDSGIRTYADDECLRCGCVGDGVETVRHGTRSMQLCGRCFRRLRTMASQCPLPGRGDCDLPGECPACERRVGE